MQTGTSWALRSVRRPLRRSSTGWRASSTGSEPVTGPVETDGGVSRAPQETASSAHESPAPPEPDRAAALAEGAPGIPSNFIWWVLGAVLVLSLGGFIGEHLFSAAG